MKLLKWLALVVPAMFSTQASASSAQPSPVTAVYFQANGIVLFYQNGARSSDAPACSRFANRYAIDGRTAAGQVIVSGFLTAYAQHKNITIMGNGQCDAYGDTETVTWIYYES